MSDKEILEKAIQKAIDGGWKFLDMPNMVDFKIKQPILPKDYPWFLFRAFDDEGAEVEVNIEHVVFDKSFAKSLWGASDDNRKVIVGETDWTKWPLLWQHYMQQMVIADDPIEYLGEHLND